MCVGGGARGLGYGPNKKGVHILEPGYTAECLQKIKRKREEDHSYALTVAISSAAYGVNAAIFVLWMDI